MNGWSWAWLAWIGAFFAIEIPAARSRNRTKEPTTLSSHVRLWFGVTGKGPAAKLRRLGLLAGLAALTVHFCTTRWG